jgi:geranylgeranyl diphosphate synthase, type II
MVKSVDERLERAFESCLEPRSSTETHLAGAVRHALSHRGSMARARLCYLLAVGFGQPERTALDLALSVELFHTASLLLDDLPCMDDAKERRGVPCTHIIFGEGVTTLAALGLVNRAYALLWASMQDATADVRTASARYVERCLGLTGILNGQSHDLHFKSSKSSPERVMRVALGKTVSLVRMSLVLPAMISGAPAGQIRLLSQLSVFWGLAYQIMDDLKDILKTPLETKKTTGRDELLGRPNLALAEGPVGTSRLLGRLIWLGEVTLDRAREESSVFETLRGFQNKVAGEYLRLQCVRA